MSTTIELLPIVVDEKGVARIEGTGFKVKHIAVDHRQGMSLEEIQEDHPHLSLDQIAAALSYYYARKAEFDAQIESDARIAQAGWEAQQQDPAFQERRARLLDRWEVMQASQNPR